MSGCRAWTGSRRRLDHRRRPGEQGLILTTFDLDQYVFAGLKAGASGFLLKDAPPAELLTAIRTVAGGDAVLAPTTTRRLIDQFARLLPDPGKQQDRDAVLSKLTDREQNRVRRARRRAIQP
jgi:DNA-binding NarL/FixJ family response regulator